MSGDGSTMNETEVQAFWNTHPCGDHIVGGLRDRFADDYAAFFAAYDEWRYRQEGHIPACLDRFDWRNRSVLEIGLGQGAESEQLIRRGARWSGLDLTEESVRRVRVRLAVRDLPHGSVRQGSALDIPWPDNSFDMVFSHGVLHHIPDIRRAQAEIHRVLKPGGTLVAMLYARQSLNYQLAIRVVRRAALAAAYPLRRTRAVRDNSLLGRHCANAERLGLRRYLGMETFTHYNTDGPLNPFARVYSPADVRADFADFLLREHFRRYLHAPPLPVHGLPGESLLGWHLWVRLDARTPAEGRDAG